MSKKIPAWQAMIHADTYHADNRSMPLFARHLDSAQRRYDAAIELGEIDSDFGHLLLRPFIPLGSWDRKPKRIHYPCPVCGLKVGCTHAERIMT